MLKKHRQEFSPDYYPELDATALPNDEDQLLPKSSEHFKMDDRIRSLGYTDFPKFDW